MKATLLNRLARGRTLLAFLLTNKAIWQMVVALVAAVDAFRGHLDAIDEHDKLLTSGTKGATRDKRSARVAMTASALTVAGALRALASKTENGKLLASMNYSRTKLNKVRDAEISIVCMAICDAATANLVALADFGVTDATVTAFKAQVTAFTGQVTQPREKRSVNRAAGEMLKVEFAAADWVLVEQIDALMARFETTEPEFYAGYLAVREVIDIPGGHKTKENPPTPTPPQ